VSIDYAEAPLGKLTVPLVEDVLALAASVLPASLQFPDATVQVVHGDPKLNNMMFDNQGKGLCLIDLDTVGRRSVFEDIGDGLRSWCNKAGENNAEASFDGAFMDAALAGYSEAVSGDDTSTFRNQAALAVIQIAIELAARFTCDIMEESYFGWNKEIYARAADHHRVRALGQLSLAKQVAAAVGL